jgi:hypothetical protein
MVVGGAGLVGILPFVRLWKNPWWVYGFSLSLACLFLGLYGFIAGAMKWPLPEPTPQTLEQWRFWGTQILALVFLWIPIGIALFQLGMKRVVSHNPDTTGANAKESSEVADLKRQLKVEKEEHLAEKKRRDACEVQLDAAQTQRDNYKDQRDNYKDQLRDARAGIKGVRSEKPAVRLSPMVRWAQDCINRMHGVPQSYLDSENDEPRKS